MIDLPFRRQAAFATATALTYRCSAVGSLRSVSARRRPPWPTPATAPQHIYHHRRPARRLPRTPIVATSPASPPPNGKTRQRPPQPPALRIIRDETLYAPSNLPTDKTREVAVTIKSEDMGGRQRRISGSILIPATRRRVWRVITAYEAMPSYLPNIVSTTVSSRDGATHIDQVGIISRKLMLRSRVLLRVHEYPAEGSVTFSRVEGRDFQQFEGAYFLHELGSDSVQLDYEVVAIPFPLYPMSLVESKVVREVPRMLAAIRDEAVLAKHINDNDSN